MKKPKEIKLRGGLRVQVGRKKAAAQSAPPPAPLAKRPAAAPAARVVRDDRAARAELPRELRSRAKKRAAKKKPCHCEPAALARTCVETLASAAKVFAGALATHGHHGGHPKPASKKPASKKPASKKPASKKAPAAPKRRKRAKGAAPTKAAPKKAPTKKKAKRASKKKAAKG